MCSVIYKIAAFMILRLLANTLFDDNADIKFDFYVRFVTFCHC